MNLRSSSVSRLILGTVVITCVAAAVGVAYQGEQTPEEKAFAAEQPRLDRLGVIAGQLYDPKANTAELMTEAAKLCGFSIWTENREKVAQPLSEPRLGYVITQEEIKWFSEMQKDGQHTTFGSLVDTLDYLYQELGGDGSCRTKLLKALNWSHLNKNPSVRAWGSFVRSANAQNPNQSKAAFASNESIVSPVELLFMMRVFTEDMTRPLRLALKAKEKELLYASIASDYQIGPFGTLPGWVEDLGSSVIMEGFEHLTSTLDLGISATAIEAYKKKAGKINDTLGILKFLLTYASLKCTFWVETPGQPLIRTTNSNPGETRTVVSQWTFDAPKLNSILKEHRMFFTLYGIDPDGPKSGPLEGVETDWQFVRGSNMPPDQLVQVHVDMSKVVTDSNGNARVEFEGKPQSTTMNRNQVTPIDKELQLQVTPQVKSTEMAQDIVDALTGAMGIHKGGLGLATPIIECMYRLKWFGTKGYKLTVRDWVPGETRGSLTILIKGYGTTTVPGGSSWERIDRQIQYNNVVMEDMGTPPPPALNLDPGLSPLVRQQAQDTYNMLLEASKSRPFIAEGPGSYFAAINDSSGGPVLGAGCGDPGFGSFGSTLTGRKVKNFAKGDVFAGKIDFEIGFAVTLDLKNMRAVVQAADGLEANRHTETDDGSGNIITSDFKSGARLMDVLSLQSGEIDVPITQAQDVGSKNVVFRGARTGVPFRFGPDNRYQGTYAVVFNLIRVPKKP